MSIRFLTLFICATLSLAAEQYRLIIDIATKEGPLLQFVQDEQDAAKRLVILEELEAQEPRSSSYAWICDQIRRIYQERKDNARVVAISLKMLQYDPLDLYSAQFLAEKGPDETTRKKWADESMRIAAKIVAQKPGANDEAGLWQTRVQHARQMLAHSDYSLFDQVRQTADPKRRVVLAEEFLRTNPGSQYAGEILKVYLNTSREIGDMARAITAAEKMLAANPDNVDLLAVLADAYYNRKGESARVLKYAGRLVEVLQGAPENDRRRAALLGASYWMMGNIYAQSQNHSQADRAFRSALPYVRGNAEMTGAILFHLGWANYKMGNGAEAARFNEQCLSVGSSLTAQCSRNLAVVKSEFRLR